MMSEWWATLLGYAVAYGAGLTAFGLGLWQLFKLLTTKWLDAKFGRHLADLQHAHAQELEQLKYKINSLFDRTVKLHQREFEVVPEAWRLLTDAYNSVDALTHPFQQYPDLDRMNEAELSEFLAAQEEYTNSERERILRASRKTDENIKIRNQYRAAQCRNTCRTQHVFALTNGIFIPDDIKALIDQVGSATWEAWHEYVFHLQNEDLGFKRPKRDALEAAREKLTELEKLIKARLSSAHMAAIA